MNDAFKNKMTLKLTDSRYFYSSLDVFYTNANSIRTYTIAEFT